MFVIEIGLLLIGILTLSAWSLLRELLRKRRDRREARELKSKLDRLSGGTLADASEVFGFPDEILEGPTGRRLYVWKLIKDDRVLTVTMTAEPNGRIVQTAWRKG